MATRDIKSVTIRADGWSADVVIEGWSGKATTLTYDYGDEAAGTSKIVFTVVSEGYDASGNLGTITRYVYGTKTIRKAYPNHAQLDEADSGSDLTVRIALSDHIYLDDNTGAGKSGTAPTVSFAVDWATESGGGTKTLSATGLAVTNNSTLVYPMALGKWDEYVGTVTRERVKENFVLATNSFHRFGVACVKFDAVGQTSSHTQSATVTTQSSTRRPKSGLWAPAYKTTITLSGYTQGELIDGRFRVYPKVGDAASVLDTNSYTVEADECRGRNKITITCDKNNALDVIKFVATTGNDSTGDGTTGNPYLTIGKAIGVGANIVKVKAGSHSLVGSAPASPVTTEWCVVQPDDGLADYEVTLNATSTNRNTTAVRLCYKNFKYALTDTSSYPDGQAGSRHLWFDNCLFDKGGVGTPTVMLYRFMSVRITNSRWAVHSTTWLLTGFSTTHTGLLFDGVDFGDFTAATVDWSNGVFQCTACIGQNYVVKPPEVNNAAAEPENLCYINNAFYKIQSGVCIQSGLGFDGSNIVEGQAFIGNLWEYTGATEPAMQIFADSNSSNANNILVWNNTVVGERSNLFYNDTSAALYTNISVKFNSFEEGNIKSDVFATNGANTGNWACLYGVGWEGNRAENNLNFYWEYGGRDCPYTKWSRSNSTVGPMASPNYNRDASHKGTDIGNGSYLPVSPSDAIAVVPAGRAVIFEYQTGQTGLEAGAIPIATGGASTKSFGL